MATSTGPGFPAAIDRFLGHLAAERGASSLTIKSYREDLLQLEEFLVSAGCRRPAEATSTILRRFAAGLHAAGYADATVARKLASLRSFYSFGQREGWVTANPARPLRGPRRARRLPKFLTGDEIGRLLAAPQPAAAGGLRDRAILELMYSAGLRVQELVNLDVGDLDLMNATVRVRGRTPRTTRDRRLARAGGARVVAGRASPPAGNRASPPAGNLASPPAGNLASPRTRNPAAAGSSPAALHQQARRATLGAGGGSSAREAPRSRRSRRPGESPHAQAQFRHPSARCGRRHPQRAGIARPQEPRDDADLHARHDDTAARRVRPSPSPGPVTLAEPESGTSGLRRDRDERPRPPPACGR
jgi:hypothetical protein